MSVYFIQVGRYFKIGYAADAQARFEKLHKSGTRYTFPADASWSVKDRSLYRVVDGCKDREHEIQTALAAFDVGLEWFLDEPAVRAFIDALPNGYDRHARIPLPVVERPAGWCNEEYRRVQHERAVRETARYMARRSA